MQIKSVNSMCAQLFPCNLPRTKTVVVKIDNGLKEVQKKLSSKNKKLSMSRINIIASKKDWTMRCADAVTIGKLVAVVKGSNGNFQIKEIYKVINSFSRVVQTNASIKAQSTPTYICKTNFSIQRLDDKEERATLLQLQIKKPFPRRGFYII